MNRTANDHLRRAASLAANALILTGVMRQIAETPASQVKTTVKDIKQAQKGAFS